MSRRSYFLGGSARSYDQYVEGMQRYAARTREEQHRRRSATAQFDPAAFRSCGARSGGCGVGAVTAVDVMVTDEIIAAAEAEHGRSRADLDAEQSSAALHWDGSSIDDQAAARLVLLSNRERTAGARVAQLAKVQAEQQAAAVARTARERAAADYLTATVAELEGLHSRLRESTAAADEALAVLVHNAQAYDDAVARCETELQNRGLVDAPGVEYPTGACGRNGVRIHGMWWSRVDSGAVLQRCLKVVSDRVLPYYHTVRLRSRSMTTLELQALDRSGLLADLPERSSHSMGKRPSLLRRGAPAAAVERKNPPQ